MNKSFVILRLQKGTILASTIFKDFEPIFSLLKRKGTIKVPFGKNEEGLL